MTDFAHCTNCAGSGDTDEGCCSLCGGSGDRPITEENLALALTAKEWADNQVAAFFETWCRISGVHAAYGVERWETYGSAIRIIQDTSCRGCYSTEAHDFPMAWFLATGEERERLIREDVESKMTAAERRRHEEKLRELQATRAKLARLENELGQATS